MLTDMATSRKQKERSKNEQDGINRYLPPKNNVRKYENLKSILANITFIRIL